MGQTGDIFASGHVVLHEPTSHLGTVGGEGGGGGNFWEKVFSSNKEARVALEHRFEAYEFTIDGRSDLRVCQQLQRPFQINSRNSDLVNSDK